MAAAALRLFIKRLVLQQLAHGAFSRIQIGSDGIQMVDRRVQLGIQRVVVHQCAHSAFALRDGSRNGLKIVGNRYNLPGQRRIVKELARRAVSLIEGVNQGLDLVHEHVDFLNGYLAGIDHGLNSWGTGLLQFGATRHGRPYGMGGINVEVAIAQNACRRDGGQRIGVQVVYVLLAHFHRHLDRIWISPRHHAHTGDVANCDAFKRHNSPILQSAGVREVTAQHNAREQPAGGGGH